jgi:hypothetical protein
MNGEAGELVTELLVKVNCLRGVPLEVKILGWGSHSVVEHLPSMCKALGSIPSTEKINIL